MKELGTSKVPEELRLPVLSTAKEARRIQRSLQEALQAWLVITSFSPGTSPSKCKVSPYQGENNHAAVRERNITYL